MLLSPLLLTALDRVLLRRHARLGTEPPPDVEEISEPQEAPVIIAGFGRYGQIVARMMLAQGVPATVLDHSVDMLEVAHTFGYRVFYGDATRLDLLRIAGAAQARVLVVAVDDTEQSLKIVKIARKHFPQLQIVARARDVTHWNALRDLGVTRVEREVFESSLKTARTVLEVMGMPAAQAEALANRFRHHNIALADRMYPPPQGPRENDRRGPAGPPATGGTDGQGAAGNRRCRGAIGARWGPAAGQALKSPERPGLEPQAAARPAQRMEKGHGPAPQAAKKSCSTAFT